VKRSPAFLSADFDLAVAAELSHRLAVGIGHKGLDPSGSNPAQFINDFTSGTPDTNDFNDGCRFHWLPLFDIKEYTRIRLNPSTCSRLPPPIFASMDPGPVPMPKNGCAGPGCPDIND
jgi:hypothetical protein